MANFAKAITTVVIALGAFCQAIDRRPTVDSNGKSCAPDEVHIPAYHIHVVFNAQSLTEYTAAKRVFEAFGAYINNSMDRCPWLLDHSGAKKFYGHVNCRADIVVNGTLISSGHDSICKLDDFESFPAKTSAVWNGADPGYYIPSQHYTLAQEWWRKHHASVQYAAHACSGCDDTDHTDWCMTQYDYKYPITAEALLCCHDGPPGCFCDFQAFPDGQGLCLTANIKTFPNVTNDPRVTMQPCENVTDVWSGFHNGVWKLVFYRPDWVQLEVDGLSHFSTYQCLAPESCEEASSLRTVDCRGPGLTRMHPDVNTSVIRLDDCPGMCIAPAHGGARVSRCELVYSRMLSV